MTPMPRKTTWYSFRGMRSFQSCSALRGRRASSRSP